MVLPFEREDVRFVTEDGSSPSAIGSGSGSNGTSRTLSWAFSAPGLRMKSIELALPADSLYDDFEFELKDVPLPKKPD